jgi:nicotinamide-nucleotide amidase
VLEKIEQRYVERGREIPDEARRLAYRPVGSRTVTNPIGAAPAFVVEAGPTLLAVMPGVPRELKATFERGVLPLLRRNLAGSYAARESILHVVGLSEFDVNRLVFDTLEETPVLQLGLRATAGEVEVRLHARGEDDEEAEAELSRAVRAVEEKLGDHVYGRDAMSLVQTTREALSGQGWRLACAESCTGGLVAKTVTDVPGASDFFLGGVAAYSDEVKSKLLGIPEPLLERCGAVSAEVASSMAAMVRRRLGAECGLSTTGIAGPTGGSADKPVGLVYLGVETPRESLVVRHVLSGDREGIRRWSAKLALDLLRRVCTERPPLGDVVTPDDAPAR